MGDSHVGLQARLMVAAMRKISVSNIQNGSCSNLFNKLETIVFFRIETTPGVGL
ncbi:hypothetical protein CW304_29280 [Bacillus sp. UFRGS-B20]|nr:hypothetical protein CW304_29280 [Bacillus sp. UFRGS-B20]